MNIFSFATAASFQIETWTPGGAGTDSDLDMLAGILRACVSAGASVSFVLPFSQQEARAFWSNRVLPAISDGSCRLLIARSGGTILGTVQLDLGTPPNQRHRAEVRKLLVHPEARRNGIARSLMTALEIEAQKAERSLLTLDTVSNGAAELLYRSMGYKEAGTIPDYAWNCDSSVLQPTTIMYKNLPPRKKGSPR